MKQFFWVSFLWNISIGGLIEFQFMCSNWKKIHHPFCLLSALLNAIYRIVYVAHGTAVHRSYTWNRIRIVRLSWPSHVRYTYLYRCWYSKVYTAAMNVTKIFKLACSSLVQIDKCLCVCVIWLFVRKCQWHRSRRVVFLHGRLPYSLFIYSIFFHSTHNILCANFVWPTDS